MSVSYFGPAPAPTIAGYLHALCYRAIETEVKRFKKTDEYLRRRKPRTRSEAVRAFKEHMIVVIRRRLIQLGWMTSEERARLSQMRDKALDGEVSKSTPLKKPSSPGRYSDAATAGAMAGASFQIERGLEGKQEERRAIGS